MFGRWTSGYRPFSPFRSGLITAESVKAFPGGPFLQDRHPIKQWTHLASSSACKHRRRRAWRHAGVSLKLEDGRNTCEFIPRNNFSRILSIHTLSSCLPSFLLQELSSPVLMASSPFGSYTLSSRGATSSVALSGARAKASTSRSCSNSMETSSSVWWWKISPRSARHPLLVITYLL